MSDEIVPLNKSDARIKRIMATTIMPNSMSLFQAFKQLEQEVTEDLNPSTWGNTPVVNPFMLRAIVLPKVTLEDVLEKLRKRLNKKYMPTATGNVSRNSKPEYLGEARSFCKGNDTFPSFPDAKWLCEFGTATFSDRADFNNIFAYIGTSKVEIIVDLVTLNAIVRATPSNDWFLWALSMLGGPGIAMDPHELDKCMDNYL